MKQLLIFTLLFPLAVSAKEDGTLSKKERKSAVNFLQQSRDDLYELIGTMDENQWIFKPNDSTWSVAEICEHIFIAEELVYTNISERALNEQPKYDMAGQKTFTDDWLINRIRDRSESGKLTAPPRVSPTGKFKSISQFKNQFDERRNKILKLAKSTDAPLKVLYTPSPLGQMNAYQWLLFVSIHTERHMDQIKELIKHDRFPKSS